MWTSVGVDGESGEGEPVDWLSNGEGEMRSVRLRERPREPSAEPRGSPSDPPSDPPSEPPSENVVRATSS